MGQGIGLDSGQGVCKVVGQWERMGEAGHRPGCGPGCTWRHRPWCMQGRRQVNKVQATGKGMGKAVGLDIGQYIGQGTCNGEAGHRPVCM